MVITRKTEKARAILRSVRKPDEYIVVQSGPVLVLKRPDEPFGYAIGLDTARRLPCCPRR